MPDHTLISKYFEGTCTAEEEIIVLEYLAGEDGKEFETLLQQEWSKIPQQGIGDTITQRMLANIEKATYERPVQWWRPWQRVAAAILIIVTIGGAIWSAGRRNASSSPQFTVTWDTIRNHQYKPQLVILADSTRVWLSPQSTLSYIVFTGQEKERSIKLEGEAFFDVAKDEQHPFVVYTGAIATKVLGTSFNIEAYSNENAMRVSLVRGAVAVSGADSIGHILKPGDMLHYSKRNQSYKTDRIRITDPDEWINGSLVFNEVPLADAVRRVAARNGLTIHFMKGTEALLKNKRLTAVFRKESCKEILDNMLFISNCYIRLRGNDLEIHASK